jgi:hypothetical protein
MHPAGVYGDLCDGLSDVRTELIGTYVVIPRNPMYNVTPGD